MSKKRGRKGSYEPYSGIEVKDILNGREIGLSKDKSTGTYYVMLPDASGSTKKKTLGIDIGIAVARYTAIVEELKGTVPTVPTQTSLYVSSPMGRVNLQTGKVEGQSITVQVKEDQYIEWLKKELQNPKALALKTGIAEFAKFGKLIANNDDIPLENLVQNYVTKIKSPITPKEQNFSKVWFEDFCKIIGAKTVEEISIEDIKHYDNTIYSRDMKLSTKKKRVDKIATIFKYNLGHFSSTHLAQVYQWLRAINRPQDPDNINPQIMSKEDFDKIYNSCSIKWKAMMLLALNLACGPTSLSQLQRENINFETGVVWHRRNKTGRVLAISILWERTKKALQEYLAKRKDTSPYIFLNQLKKPFDPDSITNSFNENIRVKAGVSDTVAFKHLRSTFATLAQDKGYTLAQVNIVLGHINKGQNDKYALRHANEHIGKMCKDVEELFFSEKKAETK